MIQINVSPGDIQAWEKMLLEVTGCYTSIMQIGVAVLSCGCIEGSLILHGLAWDVLSPNMGQAVLKRFDLCN